jgi:hypothetical protein
MPRLCRGLPCPQGRSKRRAVHSVRRHLAALPGVPFRHSICEMEHLVKPTCFGRGNRSALPEANSRTGILPVQQAFPNRRMTGKMPVLDGTTLRRHPHHDRMVNLKTVFSRISQTRTLRNEKSRGRLPAKSPRLCLHDQNHITRDTEPAARPPC